jgi:hypothetical protein
MFKDNFLFHQNKYYKMYGKNLKLPSAMRSKGTLALTSISAKKSSRLGNFFNRHLCH